jgi:hypothetical protein
MKATTKLNVLAGAMMLALGSSVQAVEIDLFDTDQVLGTAGLIDGAGSSDHSSVSGAGILGVERDMYAEVITDTNGLSGMIVGVSGGTLTVDRGSNVSGRVQIQWDGVDGDSTFEDPCVNLPPATWSDIGDATGVNFGLNGGLGLDWSNEGFIEITADFSDFGYDFQFTLFTDENSWTTVNLLANAATAGQHIGRIDLNAFTNPGLCGLGPIPTPDGTVNFITCGTNTVDIEKITAIVLDIDTDFDTGTNSDGKGYQLALDLVVDKIEVVPSPAPIALIGAGMLAAGFVGRRRRNSRV